MNRNFSVVICLAVLLLFPVSAFAVPMVLPTLGMVIKNILSFVWVLFMAFAGIMFIVAAFQFLSSMGDPGNVKLARNSLIWGMVGFFVGLIAFSIPRILGSYLGTGI